MYPGLASLLQQLSADPSDELLASRIIALLIDIPDGEYKVDQLLAAAQMLLAVSPRLALICAHAAFGVMPERLESLAIAEEALAKLGRRSKVRVLREERLRLESRSDNEPHVVESASQIMKSAFSEESTEDHIEQSDRSGSDHEATVFEHKVPIPPVINSEKTVLLTDQQTTELPDWWSRLISSPEFHQDISNWQELAGITENELRDLVQRAFFLARKPDLEVIESVENLRDSSPRSRLLTILVIDAVALIEPGVVEQKNETTYELMARLVAWSDSDAESLVTAVQNSIAMRIYRLPVSSRESLARVLRDKARAGGRPAPTFTSTML